MARFLLDTNLLLGFARDAPWALRARAEFNLGDRETMVFTSVICRGEILALAEKNGWGSQRRVRLEQVLNEVPTLDIGRQPILEAYARIDAWTHGKPVASPQNAAPAETRGVDVPRGAADVIVTDGAFDDLMRFLSAGCDVTPGTIVPRNACRGPWTYTLDFHLGVDFPRGPSELELFIDIRNLINAFDARNGLLEFAFFQNLQPVRSSVDPATGRYVYSLNTPARPGFTGDRFARDDLRSRWQAQLGVRYSFGR